MTQPQAAGDRTRYDTLLSRFAEGWQRENGDTIADIFSQDGVFLPGPFEPPLRGREAIRDYWRDLPREQAEISFRYGEIFVAGPWFATEFKCTFRRRRTGEAVVVRGALFCETAGDLISEMRMYWERRAWRS
jgi:ketosteroid isomerase-like protein